MRHGNHCLAFKSGADGLLKLQVPVKATNTELEVVLIVQPVAPTGQEHGWPPGFFETTYGSFRDQPLVREPQGEYEIRDELDPPENTASPDARPLGRTI